MGPGDRTAEACIPGGARGSALVVAKEEIVVSGVAAAARVFRTLDPGCIGNDAVLYRDVHPALHVVAEKSVHAHLLKLIGEGRARSTAQEYFAP